MLNQGSCITSKEESKVMMASIAASIFQRKVALFMLCSRLSGWTKKRTGIVSLRAAKL